MIPFFEEENFGQWLRDTRKTLLLSQRSLAKAVGLTPATVSMLERGVHDPSKATVRKIRDGLESLASKKAAIAKDQTETASPSDTKETFAHWLRESREKLALSQRELAREAGVTPATISLLERGVNTPSKKTYMKILNSFKEYSKKQMAAAKAMRGETSLNQSDQVSASYIAQELHALTDTFLKEQGEKATDTVKLYATGIRRLADRIADYESRLSELERSFREAAAERGKEIQESFFHFLSGLSTKLDLFISKK